jgi:hypothetical protein
MYATAMSRFTLHDFFIHGKFKSQIIYPLRIILQTEPFREPVDWKGLGLYDYPQIVKKPMDLGHIKRKIEKEQYSSLHEAADDVRLVWSNCKTYNADGSDFFVLAENMSKRFEEKFSKLLKELNISEDPAESTAQEPTLDEKKLFAKRLYKITKEELGKLIVDLDEMCPAAITKNSAEDQLEINIDNISPMAFKKVMEFETNCADASGKKKKSVPPNNKAKKTKTS